MKKKITTIEDLAVLAQNEFSAIHEKMDVGFSAIHEKMDIRFKEIKNEILEIKSDLEDLKLRMGNMVFRFEIQDVEKRLKRIEEKIGLK